MPGRKKAPRRKASRPKETIQEFKAYVGYPPSDFIGSFDDLAGLPHPYVTYEYQQGEPTPRTWQLLRLEQCTEYFSWTGNPLYALEALVESHRAGVYPAPSIMEFLAGKIEDYIKGDGSKRLEVCLGIKGRGVDTGFQRQMETSIHRMLCFDMLVWWRKLNVKQDDAAGLVYRRFHRMKECPAEMSLLTYFKGRKWKRLRQQVEATLGRVQWNEATTRQFLSNYHYADLCGEQLGLDLTVRSLHPDCPDRKGNANSRV